MILGILMALMADTPTLQRQERQDTIYILRGNAEALAAFQENVGAVWTGGTVIDADPSDGTLTYWAYSDRTAAESRALMMPAIMSGLQMGFEEYSEVKQFSSERGRLDQVLVQCGVKTDPFFVTPEGTVEITMPSDADNRLRACLTNGVRPLLVTNPRQGRAPK